MKCNFTHRPHKALPFTYLKKNKTVVSEYHEKYEKNSRHILNKVIST